MDDKAVVDLAGSGRNHDGRAQGGRRSFRFPMAGREVRAVVDGEAFPLLDVGSHGIAVRLEDPDRFVKGETIAHVVLILDGDKIETRGRVVHITRGGETVSCGIELKDISDDMEARLQAFLQGCREDYFAPGE